MKRTDYGAQYDVYPIEEVERLRALEKALRVKTSTLETPTNPTYTRTTVLGLVVLLVGNIGITLVVWAACR